MNIMDYIKPELIPVALVCYVIGMVLKAAIVVKDKLIPFVLGVVAIALCVIYVLATSVPATPQDWLLAIFTAVVQGVLLAGASNYVNQLIKQGRKDE